MDYTSPEARLIIAIIKSAIYEKDLKYFFSETFELHCLLLRSDSALIGEKIFKKFGWMI